MLPFFDVHGIQTSMPRTFSCLSNSHSSELFFFFTSISLYLIQSVFTDKDLALNKRLEDSERLVMLERLV